MANLIITGLATVSLTGSALALETPKFKIGPDYVIIRELLCDRDGSQPIARGPISATTTITDVRDDLK